jgi:eukaryotic-like serine/threonine-protein kinase
MSDWSVAGYAEMQVLGAGATGRVVEASAEGSGRTVAIKYLSQGLLADEMFRTRFRAEARLLMELDSPHIARLYEYVEEPAGAAIVMEHVDGCSLRAMLHGHGPAEPEAALVVLKGSLLGLSAAHERGVVHRDYKPENVLIDRSGTSKLVDFGIAARAGDDAPASGTPLYMAPEQWTGSAASPATDVYAATATFYECLTGTTPFDGSIADLRAQHATAEVGVDQVPMPLRDLVSRGMAKDPATRPADAAAFTAELEAVAAGAYGEDWEERGRRRLAALVLLLAGAGAAAAGTAAGSTAGSTATSAAGHSPVTIAAAAVTVVAVAAGAVFAVRALASSGGTHGSGHHAAAPVAAASSDPAQGGSTPGQAAAAPASCILGTWRVVSWSNAGNHYVSGSEIWHFGANGRGGYTDSGYRTDDYGHTGVANGSASFKFRIVGRQLITSGMSSNLKITIGGIPVQASDLIAKNWTGALTCSSDSLAVTYSRGHFRMTRQ